MDQTVDEGSGAMDQPVDDSSSGNQECPGEFIDGACSEGSSDAGTVDDTSSADPGTVEDTSGGDTASSDSGGDTSGGEEYIPEQ